MTFMYVFCFSVSAAVLCVSNGASAERHRPCEGVRVKQRDGILLVPPNNRCWRQYIRAQWLVAAETISCLVLFNYGLGNKASDPSV